MNWPTQDQCRRCKWCDERVDHEGLCRAYLGEVRLGGPRSRDFLGVAVVDTGRHDRRLELTDGRTPWLFEWADAHHLAGLLLQARQSYAS